MWEGGVVGRQSQVGTERLGSVVDGSSTPPSKPLARRGGSGGGVVDRRGMRCATHSWHPREWAGAGATGGGGTPSGEVSDANQSPQPQRHAGGTRTPSSVVAGCASRRHVYGATSVAEATAVSPTVPAKGPPPCSAPSFLSASSLSASHLCRWGGTPHLAVSVHGAPLAVRSFPSLLACRFPTATLGDVLPAAWHPWWSSSLAPLRRVVPAMEPPPPSWLVFRVVCLVVRQPSAGGRVAAAAVASTGGRPAHRAGRAASSVGAAAAGAPIPRRRGWRRHRAAEAATVGGACVVATAGAVAPPRLDTRIPVVLNRLGAD